MLDVRCLKMLAMTILFVWQLNHFLCHTNHPVNELYYRSRKKHFCNGGKLNQNCSDFEDTCLRFKTCCIDKLWNSSHSLPLKEYLVELLNEAGSFKETVCQNVFPLVKNSQRKYMVSTCVEGANQADIEGCLNASSFSYEYTLPVFGNDTYLYRNSFCARCNLIKNFELVNLTADCNSFTIPTKKNAENTATVSTSRKANVYKNLKSCSFDIDITKRLSNVSIKPCEYRHECNKNIDCQKSNDHFRLCLSYYGIEQEYETANSDNLCYLCTSSNLPLAAKKVTRRTGRIRRGNWNSQLSFTSHTTLLIKRKDNFVLETYCRDGELYNIITSECEVFSCSSGYQKIGNTCKKIKATKLITLKNPSFDKCLIKDKVSFIAEINNGSLNATWLKYEMESLLNTSVESKFHLLFSFRNVSFLQIIMNVTYAIFDKMQDILTQPDMALWKTVTSLYISSIPNQKATRMYGLNFKRLFPGGKLCADPVTEVNPYGAFTNNCDYQINGTTFKSSNTSLFATISTGKIKRIISLCSNYFLHSSCRMRQILSNYTVAKDLTIFTKNRFYNISQYLPTEYGISVCAKELKTEFEWYEFVLKAKRFISITGTSVSLLCYVYTILLFTVRKEMNTVASMTIKTLSGTLLTADTAFLIAIHLVYKKVACKLIAIILHWALLSVQTWTAVTAFDILSKFRPVTLKQGKSNSRCFLEYCMSAYALPSLILVVAVTLNETKVYHIGYGESNTCFIHNFDAKFYFYIIPFSITFIPTVIFCLFTIRFLSKQESKLRGWLKGSGRSKINLISVALKLSLILGMTEVVGIIQIKKPSLYEYEWIINSMFAVLYNILRSFKGVILFFVFGLHNRENKFLKLKFKRETQAVIQRCS